MPTYKTPGVYVEEISNFPPSVVPIETAIPAFIGYTEKAENTNGKDLTDVPTRISSLVEYRELFGGDYGIKTYTVTVDTSSNNEISIEGDKRFLMYTALRHFFDNGGGDCYIVSVGDYDAASISSGDLEDGITALAKFDEPTLILFPDGVNLLSGTDPDYTALGDLQKAALAQCERLKDRFVIMDIMGGYQEDDSTNEIFKNFRDNIGTSSLKYGAVYYPWVYTNYVPRVYFSQLAFEDETEVTIADLTPFSNGDADLEADVNTLISKSGDVDDIIDAIHNDDEMNLIRGSEPIEDYLKDCVKLLAQGSALKTNLSTYMDVVATMAKVFNAMDGNISDDLQTELDKMKGDTDLQTAIVNLIALEKIAEVGTATTAAHDPAVIYAPLDNTDWIGGPGNDFTTIAAGDDTPYSGLTGIPLSLAVVNGVNDIRTQLLKSFYSFFKAAQQFEKAIQDKVFQSHPFFVAVLDSLYKYTRQVPPSAAMAGIYAMTDRTRGVWKAPANVSVSAIVGPTVKVTHDEQSSMNVHETGKSINAIRTFAGKGTLVWGARTLAGNDNEWRYVSVRRFFNMVEESVMKASQPFVFEPNDANTWVKVKAMIENFLTVQWRQGALMGSKPDEAYFVKVGLGETMTAIDVLEGRMIVEIGMAAVRPAEFIILRFSHFMQEA